jgi:hypothetical protein
VLLASIGCGGDSTGGGAPNGDASMEGSAPGDSAAVDSASLEASADGGHGRDAAGTDGTSTDAPGDASGDDGGPSDGGAPIALTIFASAGAPTGIALTDTAVYWADEAQGTISTCPKTGCGANAPTVVVTTPAPRGIAIRGNQLYWITAGGGTGDVAAPAGIGKCTLGACTPVDLGALSASGPFGNVGLAANDTTLFLSGGPDVVTCSVGACNTGGHLQSTLAGPIFGLAVDATRVYMAGAFAGLRACPIAGCSAPTEPTLVMQPSLMAAAVDSDSFYWSEWALFSAGVPTTDGAIRSCPLAGCGSTPATVLAAGLIGPYAMALDTTSLYFTDHRNGRVERIPKSGTGQSCAATHYASCGGCGGVVRCDGSCSPVCDAGSD